MLSRLLPLLSAALVACSDPAGPQRPELVASSNGTPFGVAADGDLVYWTSSNAGADGKVLKIARGGEEPIELAGALVNPFGIAVAGATVVWTELGAAADDGAVWAIPAAGGAPSAVAAAQAAPRTILSDGDTVVWMDAEKRVLRSALLEGEPEVLEGARAAAIALSDEHIYWTDPDAGTIMRAPKLLGEPEEVASGQPRPRGVAVSAGHIWWTVLGAEPTSGDEGDEEEDEGGAIGELRRVSRDGGDVQTIARAQTFAGLNALVADDRGVYWLTLDESGASAVARALLPDGAPELIAAGTPEGAPDDLPTSVFDLTTDASSVYWTTFDGLTGRVLRVDK
jgi:hypothetical protein